MLKGWGIDTFLRLFKAHSLLACVASVSVLFRGKERPRNEILGYGNACYAG